MASFAHLQAADVYMSQTLAASEPSRRRPHDWNKSNWVHQACALWYATIASADMVEISTCFLLAPPYRQCSLVTDHPLQGTSAGLARDEEWRRAKDIQFVKCHCHHISTQDTNPQPLARTCKTKKKKSLAPATWRKIAGDSSARSYFAIVFAVPLSRTCSH